VEFLVGFDVDVPDGAPRSRVDERNGREATAAAGLAVAGHLVRVWKRPVAPGETKALGLYRVVVGRSWTVCSAPSRWPTGCASPSRRSNPTRTTRQTAGRTPFSFPPLA
jgi:Muconolactone delta-isomerase